MGGIYCRKGANKIIRLMKGVTESPNLKTRKNQGSVHITRKTNKTKQRNKLLIVKQMRSTEGLKGY